MGIIGFDFGEDCAVAVWKEGQGRIEIVGTNTLSAVHFTEKERIVGPPVSTPRDSDALEKCDNVSQAVAESLISGLKLLIGVKFSELDLDFTPFPVREGDDGYALVEVNHLGTRDAFKPTHLLAMIFSQLKLKAMSFLKSIKEKKEEEKCCIGVPAYFTVPQRNAVHDAAKIAGLDPWLLHETTATALAYLHYHSKNLGNTERFVAIIDAGLSRMQVSFVHYKKSQLRVLSYGSDSSLGGKQLDMLIFKHFAKQLQDKQKVNVTQNKHARIRLLNHCERVKKTICNGQSNARISLEKIMDGEEDHLELSREDFDQICDKALFGMKALLQKALEEAGLNSKDKLCDAKIEPVVTGSGSDVPAICDTLFEFFEEEPFMDSTFAKFSVAKGCALQCAIRDNEKKTTPDKRVMKKMKSMRELKIIDQFPFSITMCWEQNLQNGDNHTQLFKKGASWPCTQSFTVTPDASKLSVYASCDQSTTPTKICKCKFKWPSNIGGNTTSEIQLSIDDDGKLSVKPVEFAELVFDGKMGNEDFLMIKEKETEFAKLKAIKNDVLGYITSTLKKLSGTKYDQYVKPEDKVSFTKTLEATKDSLSGQHNIVDYVDMLAKLKAIGEPIETRYNEFKERPRLIRDLEKCLVFVESIDSVEARVNCSRIQKWLDKKKTEQKNRPKYADPAFLTADIMERIAILERCKRLKWNDAVTITYNIRSGDVDAYNEFIVKLRAVLSRHDDAKTIEDRPVLEKQRPLAQPSRWMLIRLDLGEGLALILAVRGDNIYFLGFQNRYGKWYELGYSKHPKTNNIGTVPLIPESTFLEAGTKYSAMVCGTKLGDAKLANVVVKQAMCQLNMSPENMVDDALLLLNHTDGKLMEHIKENTDSTYLESVLHACARIALRLCEPTRLIHNQNDMNANWARQQHHLIGKLVDYIWNWGNISDGMFRWSRNHKFDWSTLRLLEELGITSIELATAAVAVVLNEDRFIEGAQGEEQENRGGGEEKEEDPPGEGDDGPVGGGECGEGEDSSGGSEFGRGEGFSGGGGDEVVDAADLGGGTSAVDHHTSDQLMKQYHIRPLVELFSINADSPILGTIALFDGRHSQYIYGYEDRKANLKGGTLTLTGPFEAAIPADRGFLLEVDIPRETVVEKGDAAQWEFEWNGREKNKVTNHRIRTIQGRHLDVCYAVLTHAVEANVQLKLHFPRLQETEWLDVTVHGDITAMIKRFSRGVKLFDRKERDKFSLFRFSLPIESGNQEATHLTVSLPLDRHVLAVPASAELQILGKVQLTIGSSSHTFNVKHEVSLEGKHESTDRIPTGNAAYTSVSLQFS